MICRKACKKPYFENAPLKVCSEEWTQRLYLNQKVTKKAKLCLFCGKSTSLLEAPVIKEATAEMIFPQQNSTCLKKDQVVSSQTALRGKSPK